MSSSPIIGRTVTLACCAICRDSALDILTYVPTLSPNINHPSHMKLPPALLSVNLADKMVAANRKVLASQTAVLAHQEAMDQQIEKLRVGAEKAFVDGKAAESLDAAKVLGFDFKLAEASALKAQNAAISHLPQDRIFTTAAIKDVCLTYGLRFLPTKHFKGALDDNIPAKLEEFKCLNGGYLSYPYPRSHPNRNERMDCEYYIAAPAASFKLTPRPKDPLLFASLGSDRWYLIHKWGDDLNIGACIANWPWREIGYGAIVLACGLILGGGAYALTHVSEAWWTSFLGIFSIPTLGEFDEKYPSNQITSANWNSPFSN